MTEKQGCLKRITGWAVGLTRKLVPAIRHGEPATDATAEAVAKAPTPAPETAPEEAENPWALGTLGGCSFQERVTTMNSLIASLSRERRLPYVNAEWVVYHLHHWASVVIPGLKLNPELERLCAGAAKTLADEFIVEVRDDPQKGRVIWVPPESRQRVNEAGGKPENESPTPFVRGDQVFRRLHRWVYSIIPECPAIEDREKTACGRVVLEIAWQMADHICGEEAPGHGLVIWVPEAEIDPAVDDCSAEEVSVE